VCGEMSTSVEFARRDRLVRRILDLGAADVDVAGGKGANLGELKWAGFPVPDGFVLTTPAYAVAARAAAVDPRDPGGAAERLRTAPVPGAVAAAARDAYAALGGGSVAVRSSATAEDLPGASFAGQQDTILNVTGEEALLDAVRRCWASLWNERAVAYRAANGIADATVALAVVVQRMVDAAVAGVLFTADPITGTRRRAAIDAVRGLADVLVSGAVDPDHYLVDTRSGRIMDRRGDALDDPRVRELAAMGAHVEAHYGAPQDIEWAVDRGGKLWLVQSRAITTLYPLPADAPDPDRDLRVYFSANVAQGFFDPFTPMGVETFRLISGSLAAAVGRPMRDPIRANPVLKEAGMRIFADLTDLVRSPLGRRVLGGALGIMEARSARLLPALVDNPRLSPGDRGSMRAAIEVLQTLVRVGVARVVVRGLRDPDRTRAQVLADAGAVVRTPVASDLMPAQRIDAFERLFLDWPGRLFPKLVGLVGSAMVPYWLAGRILGDRARHDELQTVLRGLPHNPTTEMDLTLWTLAHGARGDAPSLTALQSADADELAARYRVGTLPGWLQERFRAFLAAYGHRAVGEIDLGVARWADDPTHLFHAVQGYLRLPSDAEAPDAQFARGAREADAMATELLGRVHGPRRRVLGALLRRVRANAGAREHPKFQIIRLFAKGRALLAPVGADLASRGLLSSPDDLWYLTLAEMRRAVGGEDLRALVTERRAQYRREMGRRHIPRVLLSDGTDVEAAYAPPADGALRGSPASPGTVTAVARVVRSPHGARLEPGEILVAPSTDPGWTPLFLTAGGLVMEMGGMMSHGAVVAREYGIPAVVGVAGATERIATGQRITVDGSAGTVALEA
jgi:rifampicin phosphotransferase